MAGSRKWLLIGAVVALPLIGAAVLWVSRGSIPAARRHAVFDQAWEIIGTNYYDREMNGLDWPAVHDQFEPQLRDVHDDSDLYWKLLKPMAELLESSHVQLNMPPQPQADGAARAEVPASTRGCDGMWWTPGRQNILPRVRNVEPDSILYAAGVRKNWRLIGRLQNKDQPSARIVGVFMTPAGKRVEVPLAPESGGHPVDASPVMHDFLSLQALLKNRADPWTELKMNSLGITVSIGQVPNAPSVVDVEPGSDAARAGLEPGSEFKTWVDTRGPEGERKFSATLVSPAGREYTASYSYQLPCVPHGMDIDRVARQLPGGVLYLRFNHFEPEVIPWLDERLRVAPRAVILDLRFNAGGNAEVMLDMLSRFLEDGTRAASVVEKTQTIYWTTSDSPVRFRGALAVLVGPLSSSAAEVSASAFRFHGRATLYGRTTAGKVQLSRQYPLLDGGVVQVATADVRGPGDQRLEAVGVDVDRVVIPTLDGILEGRDDVLDSALEGLARPD